MDIRGEVSLVAYEIYEQQGKPSGCELNHWTQAKRVVTQRLAYRLWEAAGHCGDAGEYWKRAKEQVDAACPSSFNGSGRDAAFVAMRAHAWT